jgi:hypothetical protein
LLAADDLSAGPLALYAQQEMTNPESAAAAIPLLREALDKVFQGLFAIRELSDQKFEQYSELLHPAQRGLLSVLSNLYAKFPERDPLVRGGASPGKFLDEPQASEAETPRADLPLDAETTEQVRILLVAAHGLVAAGEAALGSSSRIDKQQRIRFLELCSEARESIQTTLQRLS